jgi:hypothetical protein
VIVVSVEVAIVCLRSSPYISIVNGPPKRFLNHNTNQGARSQQRALIHVRKERKFRKPAIKPLSCQNCPHGTGESVVGRCQNQNALIPNTKSRAPKHGFWLMRGAQPATSAGARPFAGSPIPALFTGPSKGGEEINLALGASACCAMSNLNCSALQRESPASLSVKCGRDDLLIEMDELCQKNFWLAKADSWHTLGARILDESSSV